MYSLHYITFLIILFFLFYNAIGENKTITHEWFVGKQKWLDEKTAQWLLRIKGRNFSRINEDSYKKLKNIPLLLLIVAFIFLIIFPKNTAIARMFSLSMIVLLLILVGLTSFKRILQTIKENIRTTTIIILLAIATIILLLISGEKELLKAILVELSKFVNIIYLEFEKLGLNLDFFTPWGFLFTFLLFIGVINLLGWFVLRILIALPLWLIIAFGKLCYSLNNNRPLKPFYFLIQVGSVIFSEIILKAINP